MSLDSVARLLPELIRLRTQTVLISGGEPLLNPDWAEIAALLRANGLQLWLLSSGLSLAKHVVRASQLFDAMTVSLDGTSPATYAAIRGVAAFEKVCAGIQAASSRGVPVGVRVTLQRANYRELPEFVRLARRLGACQVSFVAVDVANPHAFGRADEFDSGLALQPADLPQLEQLLSDLERDFAEEFDCGFIAESPRKLRHIHQYFSAVCGLAGYPPVRCNAPEFSAVVSARHQISPCFFIPGPRAAPWQDELAAVLNGEPMIALRKDIRSGRRPECSTCVCTLWREPRNRTATNLMLVRPTDA
jgi:MoaA/NifB/PqqE/SkfB family radical SAM enzyme